MKPRFLLALVFLFLFAFAWIPMQDILAQSPTSTPTREPGMDFPGLLTPPPTVYPPSQADQGAQTYFYICLVCHGQSGEGLTAWRKKLDPQDSNCWTSKCHAPNHMDFGFTFPHEVPPVRNRGMLLTFQNAYNLTVFIKTKMPFQNPNSLTDEQAYQLTAYLMRINGLDPGPQPITAANAKNIYLVPTTPTPIPGLEAGVDPVFIGTGALLVAAAAAAAVFFLRRRRHPREP